MKYLLYSILQYQLQVAKHTRILADNNKVHKHWRFQAIILSIHLAQL